MIMRYRDPVVYEAPSSVVMAISISGKLTREDYENFESEFERVLATQDRVRLLILLDDFEGWTAGALWDDIKFDAKHFNDVDRIAIVGESKWEQAITFFYKPFTRAKVQYFDRADEQTARAWISSP